MSFNSAFANKTFYSLNKTTAIVGGGGGGNGSLNMTQPLQIVNSSKVSN
jgi:hypothetical protein